MNKVYKPGEAPTEYDFEEYCPYCDNAIPVVIDQTDYEHYQFKCPVCGHKLMLCTLCYDDQEETGAFHNCDWNPSDDTCCKCRRR